MTRPDVQELETFVAIANHLNFSKAARQLNSSQPPLTRRIKALEQKLGVKLFERSTHAVSLTHAGRIFLEDAKAILSRLDRAAEAAAHSGTGVRSRLRLAFVGALLDEPLLRLIKTFRRYHPSVQLDVTDLSPAAQLAALEAGELDGAFIGARPAKPIKGLSFYVWDWEPLVLALPEEHPLTKLGTLKWRQLQNLPWVMVSQQAAPAFRQQFAELDQQHQLAARIVQESDRVPAILTMVAAGSGVSFVPHSLARLMKTGVISRKLPKPEPFLFHTFAYRSAPISTALGNFLGLVCKTGAPQNPRGLSPVMAEAYATLQELTRREILSATPGQLKPTRPRNQ